ncbi:MAG: AAA family ATPase [Actinomycetia bacterium]|nr:AAA family ATPase [Actinomycetes bacterium]
MAGPVLCEVGGDRVKGTRRRGRSVPDDRRLVTLAIEGANRGVFFDPVEKGATTFRRVAGQTDEGSEDVLADPFAGPVEVTVPADAATVQVLEREGEGVLVPVQVEAAEAPERLASKAFLDQLEKLRRGLPSELPPALRGLADELLDELVEPVLLPLVEKEVDVGAVLPGELADRFVELVQPAAGSHPSHFVRQRFRRRRVVDQGLKGHQVGDDGIELRPQSAGKPCRAGRLLECPVAFKARQVGRDVEQADERRVVRRLEPTPAGDRFAGDRFAGDRVEVAQSLQDRVGRRLHGRPPCGARVSPEPRRFGKSLWLRTLAAYFDLRLADDFETLFGDLDVGRDPTPERGSYFVLQWNFSEVSARGSVDARGWARLPLSARGSTG